MKLEDAVRKGLVIDGVECSSAREFISKLEKAKNLSMEVYVNTKLVCSGPVLLRSDNNWIIASSDCQVSFKESVSVESIRVYIKQGSTELFESITTNCNTIIPANDTLATFYVCLGNDAPYNELAKRVPESRFTPISVNRIPDTSFADITSTLNDGADVTIDDEQTDHIVTVIFELDKITTFADGEGNTLDTIEWNTSEQLDFLVVTNENCPDGERPIVVVGETGELLRRDSESDNPPYYQFHVRKADIENIESRSEIRLSSSLESYYTDSNHDDPDVLATSGTFSVQLIGSTNLAAQPLHLDDETFSQELQITQNVSHTLMIPLTNESAEISIEGVDGFCLDSDIQYVDPLPDNQQRPDVVKNARVQFTMSVDYVSLNVNVFIAEVP